MENNLSDLVIMLTGTINPNTNETLVLKDPVIRRNQYIEAIRFYLQTTTLRIIFIENSGVNIQGYFPDDLNRLECLVFESYVTVPDRGKGFKEMEIIDFAEKNSEFLAESKAVVKITGRLKVLNIKSIANHFNRTRNNYKSIVSCNVYKPGKMDSRCFCYTLDFWKFFKIHGKNINYAYSFEMALWDSIKVYLINDENYYCQFLSILKINGMSGGFGTTYKENFIINMIKQIRHKLRTPSISRLVSGK